MLKFIHLTFHFEYTENIQNILDTNDVAEYAQYSMVEAKDCDGKHFGTQVFPGNSTVIQAQIEEDKLNGLLDDLRQFRDLKGSHRHLQAIILPIEQKL